MAKLKAENDADVAEASGIGQENHILSGSLEDAKSEVIKLGNLNLTITLLLHYCELVFKF